MSKETVSSSTPMSPWRPTVWLLGLLVVGMAGSCSYCIDNVGSPKSIENTHFCAEYLAQGKLDSAEARCRLAIEFCPKCAEPWNHLGMIEIARGHVERAEEHFKRALSFKNDFPEALNNLGFVHLDRRNFEQAADLFKQALEIDPGYQIARRNYATTLMYTGEADRARAEYLKCVELDPDFCDCKLGLGALALGKEDYKEARAHFQGSIKSCPNMPEGYFNLCWTEFQLGRCAAAVDACTQALVLNPEYLEARKNLTEAYECLALQDGAIKNLIDELRSNPGDPELHFKLGAIYEDEQLWDRAVNEFQNAYKLDPNYVTAYFRAARVLDRMLRAEETISHCQRFIDLVRDPKYDRQKNWCIDRVKELQFR